MSCCDSYGPWPEDTVGKCPDCDCDVDKEGKCTEESCVYSPQACLTCGWCPCDWSC